ncbi:hypothetical protein JMF89_11075 [Clostridiaceae bacterium UIB06]|uniref:Uncharacterized protein n=1 Tax=Clostridium thailandense TaxID=2794346 RepID=A0A949TYZ5_9CLOT|nr:hypothetical protein [Clostridium thailandense]MBV7275228.1 hypothetical protein [Clostridium thailandense]MCH5137739.1 hypothetical protein [Clostridiaceae bacterium UIB06]
MKEHMKDFLLNLIISMFIGLFVGMAEITVVNMNRYTIATLVISSVLGAIIGTISRLVFMYIFAIKQKDVKLAFMSVFIIIGVISCTPSLYYYLFQNIKISTISLMPILVSAELLGMGFCYYSYKKCLEFNLRLLNKKNQLTRKD